ncbi:hemolysin secretion protein D [Labrys miyagiensis]|uniref:Hemolysin secretion protein D n=1 Tax=Labrys miyagiensis TaxID=346912 RepID=A0ABQ6CP33_9HYPH|nr:hemolysin secretion protein D [Labrys miyagiensis]
MADGSNNVTRIENRVAPDKPAVEQPGEATPASQAPAPAAPAATPAPKKKRSLLRPLLFLLLPVAVVAGGYYYVTGGQVMETDNAYVGAATVGVSTDVAGTVIEIDVHNNQTVKKGDLLYRLRPDTYKIALAGAQAQLGTVRNQVVTLQASYTLALAQIEQAKADIPFFEAQYKRQQDLQSSSAASKALFDSARHDLDAANQKVLVAQAQAQAMLAQLGGDASQTVEQNPFYLQAKSAVDNAQRDLNDTVVKAPFDGIVTNVDSLQVGAYLQASQQAFNLVSTTDMWIDASPKETELTYVKPDQEVTIAVDTYPGVEWKGKVQTISPASSSSFSLLPAQNTTGNWVKVVQRIPMRVTIENDPNKPPLRVGMSAEVSVDTGHARGLPDFVQGLIDRWQGKKTEPAKG